MDIFRFFCSDYGLTFPDYRHLKEYVDTLLPPLTRMCNGVAASLTDVVKGHLQQLPPEMIRILSSVPDKPVTSYVSAGWDGAGV